MAKAPISVKPSSHFGMKNSRSLKWIMNTTEIVCIHSNKKEKWVYFAPIIRCADWIIEEKNGPQWVALKQSEFPFNLSSSCHLTSQKQSSRDLKGLKGPTDLAGTTKSSPMEHCMGLRWSAWIYIVPQWSEWGFSATRKPTTRKKK